MKGNNIIYPNTPFFRKYAGKLIMPAGVEEEGGAAFELIPAEVTSVVFGTAANPYFEVSGDDAVALFALVGPSVESVQFGIDNLTAEYTGSDSDDIFNVSPLIINEEFLEEAHNVGIDYFDDKIGQYVTIITIAISYMDGYTPLAVGEHPYELTVNGAAVSAGEFIVEPEPVVVLSMQQGIEENNTPRPSIQLNEGEGKVLIDAVVKLNYDLDNAPMKFVVFCEAQQKVKREIPVKSYGEVTEQNVASLNSQYIFSTPLKVGDYYAVLKYETPVQDDDFNWMEWYQWLAERAATIWFEDSEHSVQSDELPLNFLQK